MMRLLLFSLVSAVSLGSASLPSVPLLSYDVEEVRDWDPVCTVEMYADCSLRAQEEPVVAVEPDEAIELVMEDEAPALSPEPVVAPLAPVAIAQAPVAAQPPADAPAPAWRSDPTVLAPPPPTPPPPYSAPAPAPVADDGVRIVVSIPQQKAYVFADGELVATSPVSTGKRGHETPAGTFRILQKKVKHHSNLYSNAPMPYMQRLTHGGIALHAGQLPGYPASHGCIRLPWSFAKKLYEMTSFATRVTVTHESPDSAEEALELI